MPTYLRLILALSAILFLTWACAPPRFDRAVWMSATEHDDCRRYAMVGDVIRNVIPPGTSRAQVAGVLGPLQPYGSDGTVVYLLGMCSGLGIDWDVLFIDFDNQSKVRSASYRQT